MTSLGVLKFSLSSLSVTMGEILTQRDRINSILMGLLVLFYGKKKTMFRALTSIDDPDGAGNSLRDVGLHPLPELVMHLLSL